ncbi:hypothetical protein HanRHA438_Chr07g0307031 [Helianthus annuus]|nr:hypothetical protein HanHA300_Chr07g0244111 [Helianthus annuus]KAJ0557012.1 hypothetical protein HanIR_Chr07g0320311 [Helianthus annuus]KAJ0563277.1 hypothetical protein HanHA89_Chr07g0261291 [Helianthus annuus]KAJ0731380.1 hypothetical protein HanOQP8_Chr07g0251301 [Helianthus annuus]KAJ0904863.1 hypothetical protein HanPSC8_Chr07g0287251 [Helianthus annuus]
MVMEVVVKLMEAPYHAPPEYHQYSSRPTIGFPLGTALLLIVVFTLSGIFSCCYHWDKLRHLRGDFSDEDPHHSGDPPMKPKLDCLVIVQFWVGSMFCVRLNAHKCDTVVAEPELYLLGHDI